MLQRIISVSYTHLFTVLTAWAFLTVAIIIVCNVFPPDLRSQVYAASDTEKEEEPYLPSGIAGVVSGVRETPAPGSTINRIGTSCEEVMVGQRVKHIEEEMCIRDRLTPAALMAIGACSLEEPQPKFLSATMMSPFFTFLTKSLSISSIQCNARCV